MSSIVKVDTIQENTSANGITVDGLNIKDSKLVTANSVVASNITADAINATKIADSSIENEHLNVLAITGQTAETSIADGDTILIHDASASALRKMTKANFVSGIGGANTPYFSVHKSSDQTISNDSSTKLTFDTTDLESSSGVFDLTNNKFVCVTAGKYCFQTQVYFYDSENNLKRNDIYLYKNNSGYRKSTFFMANGGIRESVLNITWIENVSVDDYFEVYAYTNTTDSGTLTVEGGSNFQTTFSGFKLIT